MLSKPFPVPVGEDRREKDQLQDERARERLKIRIEPTSFIGRRKAVKV